MEFVDEFENGYYTEQQMLSQGRVVINNKINYHTLFRKMMFEILGYKKNNIDFTIFSDIPIPCDINEVYKKLKSLKKHSLYKHIVYIRNTLNGVEWKDEISDTTMWIMSQQFAKFQPQRRCPQNYLIYNLLKLHGYDEIAENGILKNKRWSSYRL